MPAKARPGSRRRSPTKGDWLLVDVKSGCDSHKPPPAWNKKHLHGLDGDLPVELYNLKADIGQSHNLAADHPDKVIELQEFLKKIREQGYSAPRLH
jgi:arylsulfatase A